MNLSVGADFNILNVIICISIYYMEIILTMLMYKNEHEAYCNFDILHCFLRRKRFKNEGVV